MMTSKQARAILMRYVPNCHVEGEAYYDDAYLFCAPTDDPVEGIMDPFYVVDAVSGRFKGVSITDPAWRNHFLILSKGRSVHGKK